MIEELMILNKNKVNSCFEGLTFDEEKHKYTYQNRPMKAVSYVIKDFVEPFDEETSAIRVAEKRGTTKEEILKEWETIRVNACNEGTEAHLFGENYAFDRSLKPKTKLEEAIVGFWSIIPEHIKPFIMELKMFYKQIDIAGTADILLFDEKTEKFILADYKTNIDLFKNFKDKRLLSPFSDLLDCPFSKYILQLNIYQIMFEQTGLEISHRILVHITREGSFKTYRIPDIRDRVKKALGI